jgi:hypothetical protein
LNIGAILEKCGITVLSAEEWRKPVPWLRGGEDTLVGIEGRQVRSRGWESQQFGQCGCSGLMESRAYRHFDGFQIEMARFAAGTEDDAQQLLYFAGDFLLDRFGRFFS